MAYAADKKPSELTALTSLATDDTFVVGDTSDTSEVVKTIAKSALITDLSSSFATAAQGALADSAQQPPSEGAFANGDKTKLDGIEALADVTDTTNVTAAGALMDSELTAIASVKALDQGVATTDSPTFANITDSGLTASEMVITNGTKVLTSAAVATYPSLTELTYVKGVTSAIQTQLGAKAPTASPTFTGTVTLPTGLTGVVRADSGVVSVDSDVTDIVAAASDTAAGKVELATAAETDTGTDATRAITPDGFQASKRNIRWLTFNLVEAGTDCAADTNIGGDFVSPIAGVIQQSDTTPFYFYATNSTAGTTGTMVVDVNINGTSIMTTNKLDFDTTEKTTTTAATPPDLTTTALAVGDIITIDIDSIHTTAAKGLTVYIAVLES